MFEQEIDSESESEEDDDWCEDCEVSQETRLKVVVLPESDMYALMFPLVLKTTTTTFLLTTICNNVYMYIREREQDSKVLVLSSLYYQKARQDS